MAVRKTIVGGISPEVLAFTAGKDVVLDRELIASDCVGTAAHVTMLSKMTGKNRLFSDADRKKVVKELIAIMRKAGKGSFRINDRDQDVHLAVERTLTGKLGELGKKVHTGRSRNDQVALDLRLYGKEQLLSAMDEALDLVDVLLKFSRTYELLPMVGRTHMRPAMPSSVGLWASAFAEGLLGDLDLLMSAYDYNDRCPLGSAAGYGVPIKINRKLTSRLLGFKAPIHNVLCAGNSRGKCEMVVLSGMSQVMITLSRLAEDMMMFTMPEFAYFSLAKDHCTGSSIMPQKNNPDVLELIRARSSKVLGAVSTVAGIINGLPSGYNRDLQETKELFMDGIQDTRSCVKIMTLLIKKMKANKQALLEGFTPEVFATDRALELVGKGMSFRDAYDYVKTHLDELAKIDPERAVKKKTHLGAPAGLDLDMLATESTSRRKIIDKDRKGYYGAITRLLGVKYPLSK